MMTFRISHTIIFLFAAGMLFAACKGSSTDSGGNNTTHTDIGDSIPRQGSNYLFQMAQLDGSGAIISGTLSPANHSTFVIATGLANIFGKDNAYLVIDDADSAYYAYEANSDVSLYLENPGYLQNFRQGNNPDLALEAVLNTVFHRWLTLPIATKDTGRILFNQTTTLTITGDAIATAILAKADYLGDSTFTVSGNTLTAKHCRISITATLDPVRYPGQVITHERHLWFVPKIGYFAKVTTRTSVPYIQVIVVPADTTSMLKTLASYKLN